MESVKAAKMVLYFTGMGAPCRAVLLAARALGVDLRLHPIDMHKKKEHLQEWFGKLNPQRTTPTLVDSTYVLWESRAINKYLALKQMHSDHVDKALQLWPSEPHLQSKVDRLLYFDMGTLYQSMVGYFAPQLLLGVGPDPTKLVAVEKSLQLLNHFLADSDFAAGPRLTLADISLIASVSQLAPYGYHINPSKFKRLACWEERVIGALPFYEQVSREALNASAAWAHSKMNPEAKDKKGAKGSHH